MQYSARKIYIAITALVTITSPVIASAHGIGEVYAIPVPLQYYLLGAGLAVAFSFFILAIFMNRSTKSTVTERIIAVPWLGGLIGVFKVVSVALLILTVVAGIIGSQSSFENFTPIFFWVYFLIGMSVLSIIFGNIWEKLNPWRTIHYWMSLPAVSQKFISGGVGMVLILGLFWLELVSGQSFVPRIISILLFIYTVVNIFIPQVFANWFKNGELFSVLFGFIGRLAHFEIAEDNKGIVVKDGNKKLAGTAAPWWMLGVACILLAGASFDSLKETVMWFEWLKALGFSSTSLLAPTIGIILAPLPFLITYLLGCWIMKLLVGGGHRTLDLAQKFVWSLIPIAFGYTLAHNFSLSIVAAPQMLSLISDPFGFGWEIFGTASFQQVNLLLGAKLVWFIEIGFIVIAHVVGVWYAHVLALNIFKDPSAATKSQFPMVILMVGFTVITLWLLSQPLVIAK